MKNILFLIVLFCSTSFQVLYAQEEQRVPISVWVPNQIEKLPASAKNNLENRLGQIVSKSGMLGSSRGSRFIMSANISVLTKDIVPTTPVMHAYTLDVTLYIGDGMEGTSFSSYNITVKGSGRSETKAYINAIKNIKTNNPNYKDFITEGRTQIIAYYNARCDFIIKEAQTMATMEQFDKAIWTLTSVPKACESCWAKANDAVLAIYQAKIDQECKAYLNQANAAWNTGQDRAAAKRVAAILVQISPNSSCYPEAQTLYQTIGQRIREIDNREWEFKWEKEIGLEKDRIQAIRDVGVAYGENQPQTIIYKSLW
ncbi:MAG: hypothetical protein AB8G11_06165 [Saprospiraceae bacterium]